VTADLQTCDTRSAGAFFIRRHHDVSSWIPTLRFIWPASLDQQDGGVRSRLELQGSESNRPDSRLMRPG